MSWDSLNPAVAWLGATPFAVWLAESTDRVAWLFVFHLFGLVLLLGSTVFLCLALCGAILPNRPMRPLAQAALPAASVGMALMVLSGSMIFIGGAEPYFAGQWFRLKMVLLVVAIGFHFAVFRRTAINADRARLGVRRLVAVTALVLWFAVGWSGRSIAFY
jgi:uncharacterized membrane protein SirB2